MGWPILLALAAAALIGLRLTRPSRGALQLAGAAALLACAGYAWQGSPGLGGSPTPPRARGPQPQSAFAALRPLMMETLGGTAQTLDAADAFHRQGLDAYAAGILRGAITRSPDNSDLWTGYANALVLTGGGLVSPAATLAFDRAAALAPASPAPRFFHALALAEAGRLDEAEGLWRALLAQTPANAPWRGAIERSLMLVEAMRAR